MYGKRRPTWTGPGGRRKVRGKRFFLKKAPAALDPKRLLAGGRKFAKGCDQPARNSFVLAYGPVYFFNKSGPSV
jgi:hypothetical protein